MISGIGVDLVATARVREALGRHGERFAGRILAECEWEGFRSARDPARWLAKCFAAKEAFGKATGIGIRAPVTLRALWVTRDALGCPGLGFAPAVDRWLAERGIRRHHLSLTDERDMVAAFVVLERGDA
jgi:holo-[acyl-carrier protein] synthase